MRECMNDEGVDEDLTTIDFGLTMMDDAIRWHVDLANVNEVYDFTADCPMLPLTITCRIHSY